MESDCRTRNRLSGIHGLVGPELVGPELVNPELVNPELVGPALVGPGPNNTKRTQTIPRFARLDE